MAKITSADGTVTISIDNCKCGLAGGCDLCRPYSYKVVPKQQGTVKVPAVSYG
jgi:hypothetical protein